MTDAEIQAHIDYLLELIGNLRTVILALSVGSEKSYMINTGQTTQSVTKKDLANLRSLLKESLDELQEYREMLSENESGGEILRAL